MTALALVVMEAGGAWPGQIGDSTDLVAFSSGGEDLLQRTEQKLSALHRKKQNVRVAILACNSTGGATTQRRAQLARLLLGAVTSTACGRLILSASGRASTQLRRDLLALAGQLTDGLRGTTATISVQFTEPTHGGPPGIAKAHPLRMTGTHA
jgi:hypothetical protein